MFFSAVGIRSGLDQLEQMSQTFVQRNKDFICQIKTKCCDLRAGLMIGYTAPS